jgi:propionyl-CoA carboxylase beta chain
MKEKEYKMAFAHPFQAAQRGFIDEVIQPDKTRAKLIKAFNMLKNKKVQKPLRRHGNIPL